jgi:hypothetical protein
LDENNTAALETALGNAFSPEAPAPKAVPAKAAPVAAEPALEVPEEAAPVEVPAEVDPADLLPEEEPAQEAAPEPTYELEIDGKLETVTGADRVKELMTRGLKAGRGFEENARVREALQAHGQQMQLNAQFQQVMSQDITQLNALDAQLSQYDQINWQQIYGEDPFKGMQLKEQRDQLREQRAAVVNGLNTKAAAVPGALAADRATGTGG